MGDAGDGADLDMESPGDLAIFWGRKRAHTRSVGTGPARPSGSASPRRPTEFSARHQVQVNMKHRLPAPLTNIHNRPPTLLRHTLTVGQVRRRRHQLAEQCRVTGLKLVESSDVLSRNDQDVNRRLGRDVPEGQDVVILVDHIGWDLSGGDAAEEAWIGHVERLLRLVEGATLNIWPSCTWGCPGSGGKFSIQNVAIRAPHPGPKPEHNMDRLLERSLEILSANSPPVLPLSTLSKALHRERMAVTESVLERSLSNAAPVRMIDPWLGANSGIARIRNRQAERRRWVCLTPTRVEWEPGPGTAIENPVPSAGLAQSACQIDRAVRTLTDHIDLESPIELARWIRICREGNRANSRAA